MLALPSILGAPAPKVEANAAVLSYERQKQGATCQSCDAMVGKFAQLQQESRCADNDALYDAMVRSDAAVRFAEKNGWAYEVEMGGESYLVDLESGLVFHLVASGEPPEVGTWDAASRQIEFD